MSRDFVTVGTSPASRKRGRPTIGRGAMSDAERARRYRQRQKTLREPTWSTPPHITAAVLQAFGREQFCLDPASPNPPTTPCERFYTVKDDGLACPWDGDLVWCNPPYGPGQLQKWIFKAIAEHQAGRTRKLVLLVPGRMETRGMHALRLAGADMFVLRGRLRFGGAPDVAPWASVVAVLGAGDGALSDLERLLPSNCRWGAR
jgi:DNA N-6-adenine-methyltransferase (Dam)